ncbi:MULTISPECIES: hypothetical protein [unclassified Pseudomonas]|nr:MULTISPECIES: hypothetical protein [unclassified Pseudomonas]PMX28817.1 hypothetical protein C1Y23_03695 [Pseudomonas sp. GW460-12]PMX36107.1 hypothetical protein C1Y24_07525 [Pseudomonas sp. MPR-R2A4]PMX52379.1 hypothetical protein C1Y17_19065 [Pseudomonas sp. MPR-R2A6]PMX90396.1 hypothetical protein C1Y21_16335 [Pseudomonas sp. MPR-R2A3]PMY12776.1 hypothetical protein C1Y22_14760 [Pseudomonas sp. MPR-R2A5]
MVKAIWYRFEQCQCLDIRGVMQNIPEGIHAVAELSAVNVIIGTKNLELNKNAFNQLKADGKARRT